MEDLLPCPFCGAEPVMQRKGNEHTATRSITIRCPNCRVERKDSARIYTFSWLESIAKQKWNERKEFNYASTSNDRNL